VNRTLDMGRLNQKYLVRRLAHHLGLMPLRQ